MDLDWCMCGKRTDGISLYCSQKCQDLDNQHEFNCKPQAQTQVKELTIERRCSRRVSHCHCEDVENESSITLSQTPKVEKVASRFGLPFRQELVVEKKRETHKKILAHFAQFQTYYTPSYKDIGSLTLVA